MTIREEYQKLCDVFADPKLVEELDELWLEATNYEKREDGHWYKKGAGLGNKASGFAIDIVEGRYLISSKGVDHEDAYRRMVLEAYSSSDKRKGRSSDEFEAGIFKGWLASLDGWQYPLAIISGLIDGDDLRVVEEFVLEKEIALPMNWLLKGSYD